LTKEGEANLRKGSTPSKQPSEPEELPSYSNEELPPHRDPAVQSTRPSYKREGQKLLQDSPRTLILSLIRNMFGEVRTSLAPSFTNKFITPLERIFPIN